jgi:surfeit locus 1 family protein
MSLLLLSLTTIALVALGIWQLDRAKQKETINEQFTNSTFKNIEEISEIKKFKPIKAKGQFNNTQQIIIDNIVQQGAIGQFVITPFELDEKRPLLMVNRGWIKKLKSVDYVTDITVNNLWRTINGRIGQLPKIGIRNTQIFSNDKSWPRITHFPTLDEISIELKRETFPFILLLSSDDPDGFKREWKPIQSGPKTHYFYAIQWFLMALVLLIISVKRVKTIFKTKNLE